MARKLFVWAPEEGFIAALGVQREEVPEGLEST